MERDGAIVAVKEKGGSLRIFGVRELADGTQSYVEYRRCDTGKLETRGIPCSSDVMGSSLRRAPSETRPLRERATDVMRRVFPDADTIVLNAGCVGGMTSKDEETEACAYVHILDCMSRDVRSFSLSKEMPLGVASPRGASSVYDLNRAAKSALAHVEDGQGLHEVTQGAYGTDVTYGLQRDRSGRWYGYVRFDEGERHYVDEDGIVGYDTKVASGNVFKSPVDAAHALLMANVQILSLCLHNETKGISKERAREKQRTYEQLITQFMPKAKTMEQTK